MSQSESRLSRRSFLRSAPVLAGAGAYLLGLKGVFASATGPIPTPPLAGARSIVDRIRGLLVPIMPAYTAGGKLDLDSTCGWMDWLVARGVRMFWMTPGTTRYKNLSDDEINALTRAAAAVTKGRAVLITCTQFGWTADQCIRYAELSRECGADIVKVTCNWGLKPDVDEVFELNRKVAEASPLPLFTYALPGFPHAFLERILDLPQFVGIKNDSGNYRPHTDMLRLIRLRGATFSCMTGGSMKPYLLVHPLGSRAFADIRVAGVAPRIVLKFARLMEEQKIYKAARIVQDYEEPLRAALSALSFRHPYRTCLYVAGHFKSDFERNPDHALRPDELPLVRQALESLGLL